MTNKTTCFEEPRGCFNLKTSLPSCVFYYRDRTGHIAENAFREKRGCVFEGKLFKVPFLGNDVCSQWLELHGRGAATWHTTPRCVPLPSSTQKVAKQSHYSARHLPPQTRPNTNADTNIPTSEDKMQNCSNERKIETTCDFDLNPVFIMYVVRAPSRAIPAQKDETTSSLCWGSVSTTWSSQRMP